MGIIYAIITALSSTGMYVLTKLLVDNQKHPIVNSGLFQIAAGTFLLFTLLFLDFKADISLEAFGLILLSSILYTGYNIAHFNSYKYLDISLVSILAQVSVIVGFLGSVVVFSENITTPKVVGTFLILIGNTLVFLKGRADGKINLTGVVLKIVSSTLLGLAFIVDAKGSQFFTVSLYGALVYIIPGIFTLIYAREAPATILNTFKTQKAAIIATSLFGAVGLYTLLKAYSVEEKTVIVPIINITTILVVLSGVLFFKERDLLVMKFLSAFISVIGVVILGLA